jgi:hypothetical protein
MPPRITYDHKQVPHTTVAMPKDRADAILRVTERLGISQHAFIQKCITMGLAAFGETL